MSKLQLLSTLYEYNEWANTVILDAAAELPAAELAAATTASHESVISLLVHTLGTEVFWLTRWKGDPFPTTPLMQPDRPLESLRESFARGIPAPGSSSAPCRSRTWTVPRPCPNSSSA